MPRHPARPRTATPEAARPLALALATFFAVASVWAFFSLPGWVTVGLLVAAGVSGVVAVLRG